MSSHSHGKDFDGLAVNDQLPALNLNLTLEPALSGVVLKQVGLQEKEQCMLCVTAIINESLVPSACWHWRYTHATPLVWCAIQVTSNQGCIDHNGKRACNLMSTAKLKSGYSWIYNFWILPCNHTVCIHHLGVDGWKQFHQSSLNPLPSFSSLTYMYGRAWERGVH